MLSGRMGGYKLNKPPPKLTNTFALLVLIYIFNRS